MGKRESTKPSPLTARSKRPGGRILLVGEGITFDRHVQYHDAGIRGIGHDTVGLVNFDDGNAAGGNRHGLPRPLKALAIR